MNDDTNKKEDEIEYKQYLEQNMTEYFNVMAKTLNGTFQIFHDFENNNYETNDNKKIMAEYTFVCGKLDGVGKEYDKEGNIYSITNYVMGKRVNRTDYYTNGNIMQCAVYNIDNINNENHIEAITTFYNNENNSISEKGNFSKGKRHGITENYDKEGRITNIVNYEKGEMKGIFKTYYYDKDGNQKTIIDEIIE